MYLSTLTVSSTALVGTITASPLRQPGPSDTPIFSVVSADPHPTSAIASLQTVTTTATATVTKANINSSPYPAFNASSYPHHNFTIPREGNCTKDRLQVSYQNGTESFNVAIFPMERPPVVHDCGRGHHGKKNETKPLYPHDGNGFQPPRNLTAPGRPERPIQVGEDTILFGGANGKVLESVEPANNGAANDVEAAVVKAKRGNAADFGGKAIWTYVKEMMTGKGSQGQVSGNGKTNAA